MTEGGLDTRTRDKIALALGLTVSAGAWWALRWLGPPPAPTTNVLVATRDISPYVPLTADDLGFKTVPLQGLDGRALRDPKDAIGRVAVLPILTGETVIRDKLGDPDQVLGPGYRAVAIRTDLVGASGGQVRPGDTVDVYWVPKGSGAAPEGGLLAANVRVLDVRAADNRPYRPDAHKIAVGVVVAGQSVTAGTATMPGLVVLRLTPPQIPGVILAAERGAVYLARHGFGAEPRAPAQAPVALQDGSRQQEVDSDGARSAAGPAGPPSGS